MAVDEKEVLNQLIYAHLSFAPGNVYWARLINTLRENLLAKIKRSVKVGENEHLPIPLRQLVRHPKEGRFNSHRVDPRFPPSAPHEGGPRLPMFFGFNTARGNVKAFCIGGVL